MFLGVLLSALSLVIIAKPEKSHFHQSNTQLKTAFIVVLLVVYSLAFDF